MTGWDDGASGSGAQARWSCRTSVRQGSISWPGFGHGLRMEDKGAGRTVDIIRADCFCTSDVFPGRKLRRLSAGRQTADASRRLSTIFSSFWQRIGLIMAQTAHILGLSIPTGADEPHVSVGPRPHPPG